MKFYAFFALFFFYLISFVKTDIPTHCLTSQVIGKWIFEGTKTKIFSNVENLYSLKCGMTNHILEKSIIRNTMKDNEFTEKFSVELNADHTAIYNSNNEKDLKGTWTMVYDEGFEIVIGDKYSEDYKSFFIFLKYSPNDYKSSKAMSKWVSHCYQTLVGWFHVGNQNWGCFRGHKDVPNFSIITNGEASDKQIVLENSIKSAFIEEESLIKDEINKFLGSNRFMQNNWKNSNKLHNQIKIMNQNKVLSELRLTMESKNHNEVVERINSMNLSWKAAEYNQLRGYTIGELNEFLRNKKNDGKFNYEFTRTERYKTINNESSKNNYSALDYTSILGNPKSQGNCGSCYAVSTISMLEARFNKKYKDVIKKYHSGNIEFSEHQVLKCSYYNQGCNGGYSHLVSKFFKEYEIIPSRCFDNFNSKCHQKCKGDYEKLNKLKFKIKDYYYVGGYFGAADEENFLKELTENGPFVVSIAPDYGFMSYSHGIYDSNTKNWKTMGISKPQWQKVDHSVLLVGHGVDNGIEYWKVLNSWGSSWGERGYMRIIKGKNLINIESLGEAATVELEVLS